MLFITFKRKIIWHPPNRIDSYGWNLGYAVKRTDTNTGKFVFQLHLFVHLGLGSNK